MAGPAGGFDGRVGRVTASVMARLNRDMEIAAVGDLDPGDGATILSIGFGPGVGLAHLADRYPSVTVAGIDPSATMVAVATARNDRSIRAGRVVVRRAGAEAIPWPDGSFHGVVAVNSIQLWRPLDAAVAEVARVLRPAGTFVALTHAWAVEKAMPLSPWIAATSKVLTDHGFVDVRADRRRYRSGRAVVLRARAAS